MGHENWSVYVSCTGLFEYALKAHDVRSLFTRPQSHIADKGPLFSRTGTGAFSHGNGHLIKVVIFGCGQTDGQS